MLAGSICSYCKMKKKWSLKTFFKQLKGLVEEDLFPLFHQNNFFLHKIQQLARSGVYIHLLWDRPNVLEMRNSYKECDLPCTNKTDAFSSQKFRNKNVLLQPHKKKC